MNNRFIVDGLMHDHPDADYGADGPFPPFVVFDQEAQRNLPGEFEHRLNAELVAKLMNDAIPKPPPPQQVEGPKNFCVSIERTDFFSVNVVAEDAATAQDLALEIICQDENPDIDSSTGFEVNDVQEIRNGL